MAIGSVSLLSIAVDHWAPARPSADATASLVAELALLGIVVPCVVALSAARWVGRRDRWWLAGLASWPGVVFVAFILPTGPDAEADEVGITFPEGWTR